MATTLLQLRDRARARADQDSADFPEDSQYNVWLTDSAKDVWYDLLQAGWPVSFTSKTFTTSSLGVARFVDDLLITDPVAAVRGVYRIDGSTLTELNRLNEGDRAGQSSTSVGGPAYYYDITIHPSEGFLVQVFPPCAGSFRVDYISEFLGFSSDSDTWYGPARTDELIEIKAAIKGCKKEGRLQDAEALKEESRELWLKVTAMASWVNMRHSTMIRDVMGSSRRDPFDFDVVPE